MESWIKVNKTSGKGNDTVSITLEPNKSDKDRTGSVDIHTSSLNKILNITQKGIDNMDVIRITTPPFGVSAPPVISFNNERLTPSQLVDWALKNESKLQTASIVLASTNQNGSASLAYCIGIPTITTMLVMQFILLKNASLTVTTVVLDAVLDTIDIRPEQIK